MPSRLYTQACQNRFQSGGYAILVVGQGYLPASATQVFRRISHDNRVSSKGKHFYVVVIVTDGHDPLPGKASKGRPALQSVSLGAVLVKNVDNGQVPDRVFRSQYSDLFVQMAALKGRQRLMHARDRA